MSELFGAPNGILAWDQNRRQELGSSLGAAKALAELEQAPAEKSMKEAQARYYGALAEEHQAKAGDMRMLQELETAARAEGSDATVADAAAARSRTSLSDQLTRTIELGARRGVPTRVLAPLAEKAALIQQREASAASARAEEIKRTLDAQEKEVELIGRLASAALVSPQAYAQARLMAVNQGMSLDGLPEDWNAARPQLQTMVDTSLTAKEKIELDRKKIQDEAQRKRWGAANARDAAAVTVAGARYNLINERYQDLKKNGGAASPEVVALRNERKKASEERRAAQERKEFPPAPIDPAAREFGKNYTAANGTKFVWMKDPVSGKGVGMALPNRPAPAASSNEDDEDD